MAELYNDYVNDDDFLDSDFLDGDGYSNSDYNDNDFIQNRAILNHDDKDSDPQLHDTDSSDLEHETDIKEDDVAIATMETKATGPSDTEKSNETKTRSGERRGRKGERRENGEKRKRGEKGEKEENGRREKGGGRGRGRGGSNRSGPNPRGRGPAKRNTDESNHDSYMTRDKKDARSNSGQNRGRRGRGNRSYSGCGRGQMDSNKMPFDHIQSNNEAPPFDVRSRHSSSKSSNRGRGDRNREHGGNRFNDANRDRYDQSETSSVAGSERSNKQREHSRKGHYNNGGRGRGRGKGRGGRGTAPNDPRSTPKDYDDNQSEASSIAGSERSYNQGKRGQRGQGHNGGRGSGRGRRRGRAVPNIPRFTAIDHDDNQSESSSIAGGSERRFHRDSRGNRHGGRGRTNNEIGGLNDLTGFQPQGDTLYSQMSNWNTDDQGTEFGYRIDSTVTMVTDYDTLLSPRDRTMPIPPGFKRSNDLPSSVFTDDHQESSQPKSYSDITKDIFLFVLRNHDGIIALEDIEPLFREVAGDQYHMFTWFKKNTNFKVFENKDNSAKSMVAVFQNGFKLCTHYSSPRGCSKQNCSYLHICRNHVTGHCDKFELCKLEHDMSTEHNERIRTKFKSHDFIRGDLTQPELLLLIRRSCLQICCDYNSAGCNFERQAAVCPFIHICRDYVSNKCSNRFCKKRHDFEASKETLEEFKMATVKDDFLRMTLLDMNRNEKKDRKRASLKPKGFKLKPPNTDVSKAEKNNVDDVVTRSKTEYAALPSKQIKTSIPPRCTTEDTVVPSDHINTANPAASNVNQKDYKVIAEQVFEALLKPNYGGEVEIGKMRNQSSLGNLDMNEVKEMVKRHRNKFKLFENYSNELESVLMIHRPGFQLCMDYIREGCQKASCNFIHLCKEFVAGKCQSKTIPCSFCHNLDTSHNRRILKQMGLDGYNTYAVLLLIRCCSLRICDTYIRNSHCSGDTLGVCPYVHVCPQFVSYDCHNTNCKMTHSFHETAVRRTLLKYLIIIPGDETLKRMILFPPWYEHTINTKTDVPKESQQPTKASVTITDMEIPLTSIDKRSNVHVEPAKVASTLKPHINTSSNEVYETPLDTTIYGKTSDHLKPKGPAGYTINTGQPRESYNAAQVKVGKAIVSTYLENTSKIQTGSASSNATKLTSHLSKKDIDLNRKLGSTSLKAKEKIDKRRKRSSSRESRKSMESMDSLDNLARRRLKSEKDKNKSSTMDPFSQASLPKPPLTETARVDQWLVQNIAPTMNVLIDEAKQTSIKPTVVDVNNTSSSLTKHKEIRQKRLNESKLLDDYDKWLIENMDTGKTENATVIGVSIEKAKQTSIKPKVDDVNNTASGLKMQKEVKIDEYDKWLIQNMDTKKTKNAPPMGLQIEEEKQKPIKPKVIVESNTARSLKTQNEVKMEPVNETEPHNENNSMSPETDLPTASHTPIASQSEIHKMHIRDGDVDICEAHLRNECKDGTTCSNHHCAMPYLWQIEICGIWENFENNEEIECEFSQPRNETAVAKHGRRSYKLFFDSMLAQSEIETKFIYYAPVRRLSTKSYVQGEARQSFYTLWLWYWQEYTKDWYQYALDKQGPSQDIIELRYQHRTNIPEFHFELDNRRMNLDLVTMQQTNLATGTKRSVRRRPHYISFADVLTQTMPPEPDLHCDWSSLPSHWAAMDTTDSDTVAMVELPPIHNEFNLVRTEFHKTLPDKIRSIQRVQNRAMWDAYTRKRDELQRKKPLLKDKMEKQLFHGTEEGIVKGICHQNFDPRMHGKNATMYGCGSYFATTAKYSNSYTSRGRVRHMFLARVLVGEYAQGNKTLKRPPPMDPTKPHGALYDSCVNNTSNPQLYVVFDRDQCYPEYLIEYEHDDLLGVTSPKPVVSNTSPSTYPINQNNYPQSRPTSVPSVSNSSAVTNSIPRNNIPQSRPTAPPLVAAPPPRNIPDKEEKKCVIQ